MPMRSPERAAAIIAAEARAAVAARGRFVVAVSGGHTPWLMLRALADEDVPWAGVHVVQVDERVAPAGTPGPQSHPPAREPARRASAAARADPCHAGGIGRSGSGGRAATPQTLRQIAGSPPVLDLAHLGLGPDGHTASLVPGDPVLDVTDADVALTGVYQGRRRMTLTYPMLNRSRRILWLVTGSEKAEMLARLRRGDQSIPAGRIRQRPGPGAGRPRGGGTVGPSHHCAEAHGETSMRVGIATDHGGFGLKEDLVAQLRAAGHEVVDFGAHKLNPDDDYPDFVIPLAQAVAAGTVERGVAVCGSGVGASVCANKVPGVRAALIHDHFSARQGVEDDHMNILCMGGRDGGPERRLGPRRDVPGRRVQPGRAPPAPPGQGGVPGSSTDEDKPMSIASVTDDR